jgi:hypothetical protein
MKGLRSESGAYEECRPVGCDMVLLLKNRRVGGMFRFHHHGGKNQLPRNNVSNN